MEAVMIRRLLERLHLQRRRTYREAVLRDEPILYWPNGTPPGDPL